MWSLSISYYERIWENMIWDIPLNIPHLFEAYLRSLIISTLFHEDLNNARAL